MGRTAHDYDILTRLAVGNGALVYRAVDKITRRRRGKRRLARRSASFRLRPPSVPRRKKRTWSRQP